MIITILNILKNPLVKSTIYFCCSLVIFFAGMVSYGIVLNSGEISLRQAMMKKGFSELKNVSIIIKKGSQSLELYEDTVLVKSYKAVLGRGKGKIKVYKDDYITPCGIYQILLKDSTHKYHKFLRINYPNHQDLAEALKEGLINRKQFIKISEQINKNQFITGTDLDVEIGIHGTGEYDLIFRNLPFAFNWTNGSIAISNKGVDELFSVVKLGANVEIKN